MRMGMRPQGKALLGTICLRTVGIIRLIALTDQGNCGKRLEVGLNKRGQMLSRL